MSDKLLHTESVTRYTSIHHLRVKLEYYYVGNDVDDGEIEIIKFVIKLSGYFAISVQF
jgi:hypothetical protein